MGVAHGIGDALTFWILDDQAKQILARSVVRPFNQSLRVKWDPQLSDSSQTTATSAGEGITGLIAADTNDQGQEKLVIEIEPDTPTEQDGYVNQG